MLGVLGVPRSAMPAAHEAPALATAASAPGASASAAASDDRWRARADPVFRHVALPSSMQTTAMAQDAQGFLWLGTQTGLMRWDGYRFDAHPAEPGTPGGLPDGFVTALHVDPSGRLWIGTSAGGLARRDAATDRFELIPEGPAGLSKSGVSSMADDGRGGLWVGTGAGLDHLQPDGRTVQRHADAARLQGLPDGSVTALLADASGTLWVGTRAGLFRRTDAGARFEAVDLGLPAGVSRLAQDGHGRVWVGTQMHGAYVVARGAARAMPVRDTQAAGAAGLQGDTVFGLAEAGPEEMWIGTDGGGVVRVDTRSWTTQRIRHREHAPATLADDDVSLVYRDRSGLVWVGTNTALSAHDPRPRGLGTWLGHEGRTDGIPGSNVVSILPMPGDTLWLGMGDGGVAIVHPVRGLVARVRPDPARPAAALPKGRVMAMVRGPSGEVYLGTQEGLYRADAAGSSFRRVMVPGRDASAPVRALWAGDGQLWLGGLDGLWRLRVTATGVQALARVPVGQVADERVTAIAGAPGGRVWVGTRAGLVLYDPAADRMSRWPQDAALARAVPAGYVSAAFTDARGRVWIASYGTGIHIVEPGAESRVRRLGTREGLPHDGVNAMLLDAQGDVWASTDNGLARIDGRSLQVTSLGGADGVGISAYWTTSAAVAPGGELLFGGDGGMAIVQPRRHAAWDFQPPVQVTALDLGAGRVTHQHSPKTGPAVLALEAARRSLHVEFAALDYSAPEANRYAYRLRGFDKDWIDTDATRRFATYTNLPPGDYVLELRGSNRSGAWSPPLQWPVRALPRWYETGVFRVAATLAALLAVAGLLQARTLVLQRRQRVLQQLVDERTAELQQRTEALRESEQRLAQMAYFDGLTGLPNRRRFNEEVARLLARAQRGEPFTLLLIDLDKFKQINDSQGHDAGDALLVAMAARLLAAVREVDMVARLGGDEFAVLLAGTAERQAVEGVCLRIVDGVRLPVVHQGATLHTSASIGAAACPRDGADAEALYKAADVALYEVKRAGRDGWRWREPAGGEGGTSGVRTGDIENVD